MTVKGIKTKPAEARAIAPVVRLAKLESRGREEEEYVVLCEEVDKIPAEVRRLERATC